ncbi:MAG: M23 family metallopeptidase, partial [Archangium sp.]
GKMPQARVSRPGMDAPESPELRASLAAFATLARAARAQVKQGSVMPSAQADNWRRMNATLDTFLRLPVRKTSSLDVVRARVTLEAELEQDARAYGDIPGDLADAVLSRVDLLAARMAELRRLQLQPSKKALRFIWPVDPVVITSVFGSRMHPILGEEREHQGLDLAAKAGQLVTAAAGGVVVRAGWNGGHGNQVVLQHDGNVTTRYSHLSRILVEPGEVLEQGDVVGAAGMTGLATGVHLHFEIWRDGEPCDPLDELGPTESGEDPVFVQHEEHDTGQRKGRRPMVGRRPH